MSADQARQARKWEKPAMVVALLVIPYLLLNYYAPDGWETVTDVLYVLIWAFFVVEAIAMLRLAPDNWAWARRNVLDITILLLTAPVSVWPEDFEALQVLWLLRILDLLPLFHQRLFRITVIRFAALLWLLVIFGGGLAYAMLLKGGAGAPDLLDSVYWANTTVSTVGYGDVLPTNEATKVLAMVLQATGVILGAILVAGVLPLFDREFAEGFSDRVAEKVARMAGDIEDIERDIEDMARGEQAQDRVLAQIARDLGDLKRHEGIENGAADAEREVDRSGAEGG